VDVTFEFHHDGDGGPDLIELRGVSVAVAELVQQAGAGELPPSDVLTLHYWVDGQYRESPGVFRAGRIHNVRIR
jgi:hypothetical protein